MFFYRQLHNTGRKAHRLRIDIAVVYSGSVQPHTVYSIVLSTNCLENMIQPSPANFLISGRGSIFTLYYRIGWLRVNIILASVSNCSLVLLFNEIEVKLYQLLAIISTCVPEKFSERNIINQRGIFTSSPTNIVYYKHSNIYCQSSNMLDCYFHSTDKIYKSNGDYINLGQ